MRFVPLPHRRCPATTKNGSPCPMWSLRDGTAFCYQHEPQLAWRRYGYQHPMDFAIDCWAARVERDFRERRRGAA